MEETHTLDLNPACPVTGNPRFGSSLSITYTPAELLIEVASLRAFVDSYKGGRGPVRSMEGMIQEVAQTCADTVQVECVVTANLIIDPSQRMNLRCVAGPALNTPITDR